MKNKVVIIVSSIALLVGLTIFGFWLYGGNRGRLLKYVPKEAVFVGRIGVRDLIGKIDFEKLEKESKYSEKFNEIKKDAPEFLNIIMDSPKESGIDFKADPVIFTNLPKRKSDSPTICALIPINDKKVVEKLLKSISDEYKLGLEFQKIQNNSFELAYSKENQNFAFTFNEDALAIFYNDGAHDKKDVLTIAEDFAKLEADDRMYSNSEFSQFVKNSNDLDLFVNLDQMQKSNLFPSDFKIDKNLLGFSLHLAFKDDAVELGLQSYFDDESEGLMLFSEDKQDSDYMDYITKNGKVVGVFWSSFNIPEIEKFISRNDKKFLSEAIFEGQNGFRITVKDVLEVLSGEVIISMPEFANVEIDDIEFDENFEPKKVKKQEMRPIFNIQVGMSKANKVKEFLDNIVKNGEEKMAELGGIYTLSGGDMGRLSMTIVGNRLLISSDPEAMRINKSKAWKEPDNKFVKELLADNKLGLFVSLNEGDYPSDADKFFREFDPDKIFRDITMKMDNDKVVLNINLNEGKDNSLHRMLLAIENWAENENLTDLGGSDEPDFDDSGEFDFGGDVEDEWLAVDTAASMY